MQVCSIANSRAGVVYGGRGLIDLFPICSEYELSYLYLLQSTSIDTLLCKNIEGNSVNANSWYLRLCCAWSCLLSPLQ